MYPQEDDADAAGMYPQEEDDAAGISGVPFALLTQRATRNVRNMGVEETTRERPRSTPLAGERELLNKLD